MGDDLARSTTTSKTDLSGLKPDDDHSGYVPSATDLPIESPRTTDLEKQPEILEPQVPGTPARSKWKWALICLTIYVGAFVYGLDNTIVADIQPATVETFGEVDKLAWLGIGFPLGSIALIMSLGKAYGVFNVKWLFIVSELMFLAGSALCGAAPSMNALIVGRVWAGAGGAGMYLGLLNLIGIYTNDKERALYNALCGLTWGLGCILGPVIGGSFADSGATWRWAFYINLVIFALVFPVSIWTIDSYDSQPEKTVMEKIVHFDWIGLVLNAGLYTALVMLFTFAGAQYAWDDGRIIALFVVFGVLLISFAIQQYFCIGTSYESRIFPVDFLKRRTLVLLYILTACVSTVLFVVIYYIPLYFAFAKGDSGVQSAVRLLPFICVDIFFCVANGILMPIFKVYQPWYVVAGFFVLAGGAGTYAVLDLETSPSTIYGLSVLMAIGAGMTHQAAYSIAPAKVSPSRISDAIGFINSAQIGSIVLGLTIAGAIFQNLGYSHVAEALTSTGETFNDTDIRAALAGAKSDVFAKASPEAQRAVLQGIVKTIDDQYILVIVAGALAIVCSVFLRRERLFMEMGAGG